MENQPEPAQGDARQGRQRGRAGTRCASSPAASDLPGGAARAGQQLRSVLRTALLSRASEHLCASLPSHLRAAQPWGFFPRRRALGSRVVSL